MTSFLDVYKSFAWLVCLMRSVGNIRLRQGWCVRKPQAQTAWQPLIESSLKLGRFMRRGCFFGGGKSCEELYLPWL